MTMSKIAVVPSSPSAWATLKMIPSGLAAPTRHVTPGAKVLPNVRAPLRSHGALPSSRGSAAVAPGLGGQSHRALTA